MPFQNGAYVLPTDPGEVQALVDDVKALYTDRDKRMQDEQDMFEMRNASTEGKNSVNLNDAQVLVNKAAAMIAAKEPRVEVAGYEIGDDTMAQELEDLLYWWRREAENQYTTGVHVPLTYAEAQSILLRGWVCGRLLLRPDDPTFPWEYTLLDPLTIYPMLSGNRTLYVAQNYRPTVAEVLTEWPEAEQTLGDRDPKENVEYTALYTDTEFCVLVDGEFLKPPEQHDYNFNPIIISLASGAFYRSTEQHASDWTKYMGTSLITPVYQPIRDKQDLALMMRVLISKEAEPPTVLYTDDEDRFAEMDLQAGGRMVFGQRDKVELLHTGPNLQNLMPLMEMYQAAVDRGSVGPSAFADGMKAASGFQEYVQAGSARDMMFPFVRGLSRYYLSLYDRVLRLYAYHVPQPISFVKQDPNSNHSQLHLGPDPIAVQGAEYRISVDFDDVTPQNEMSKAQIGNMAMQSKILDPAEIRSRYYNVRNPQLTEEKVLASLIMQNPMVVQALSQAAVMMSGNPMVIQAMQQAMMMAGPQGPQPPGGPPQPGQEQPPPPGSGTPNNVLPDELNNAAGGPPNAGAPPGPVNSGTINQGPLPGTM